MSTITGNVQPIRDEWEQRRVDYIASHPFPCPFCCHRVPTARRYKTQGWLNRHLPRCWYNPEAEQYTSGDYDPILGNHGQIAGWIWNGRDEWERRRIRESLMEAGAALGFEANIGPSHREVVPLGPDPMEQCARCPETRRHHEAGPCDHPACNCEGFVTRDEGKTAQVVPLRAKAQAS